MRAALVLPLLLTACSLFAPAVPREGEGDVVVGEGEGDVVGEGEGDVVGEGEGDVVGEGEGDGVGEGEGDGDGGCGDTRVQAPEACDDGNIDDGDGCSADCGIEVGFDCDQDGCVPVCGDAIVAGGEPCDNGDANHGNHNGNDGLCSDECTFDPDVEVPTRAAGDCTVTGEGQSCGLNVVAGVIGAGRSLWIPPGHTLRLNLGSQTLKVPDGNFIQIDGTLLVAAIEQCSGDGVAGASGGGAGPGGRGGGSDGGTAIGANGGGCNGGGDGAGLGGAVLVVAAGNVVVSDSGRIAVDGGDGSGGGGGGGGGGRLSIEAGALTLDGTVTANGGRGCSAAEGGGANARLVGETRGSCGGGGAGSITLIAPVCAITGEVTPPDAAGLSTCTRDLVRRLRDSSVGVDAPYGGSGANLAIVNGALRFTGPTVVNDAETGVFANASRAHLHVEVSVDDPNDCIFFVGLEGDGGSSNRAGLGSAGSIAGTVAVPGQTAVTTVQSGEHVVVDVVVDGNGVTASTTRSNGATANIGSEGITLSSSGLHATLNVDQCAGTLHAWTLDVE